MLPIPWCEVGTSSLKGIGKVCKGSAAAAVAQFKKRSLSAAEAAIKTQGLRHGQRRALPQKHGGTHARILTGGGEPGQTCGVRIFAISHPRDKVWETGWHSPVSPGGLGF